MGDASVGQLQQLRDIAGSSLRRSRHARSGSWASPGATVWIEAKIDRSVTIERVDLLIANLIVEYVGIEEFVPFAAANARSIGVLSCVIQRNDAEGFVGSTDHTSSFEGLAAVSSDIDLRELPRRRRIRGSWSSTPASTACRTARLPCDRTSCSKPPTLLRADEDLQGGGAVSP